MSSASFMSALQSQMAGFDLNDHSSMTTSLVSINAAFIGLTAIVVGLRVYVRCGILRSLGIDDVFMILALACSITMSSFCFRGAHYGLGQHIWNIATDVDEFLANAKGVTQSLYGSYLSYATAIMFTKCSIIASYLRIFPNPVLRKVVQITGIVVLAIWLCSLFTIVFQCIPVNAAWDWSITDARCIDLVSYLIVSSSVGIVTDVILVLAPIPFLVRMNMTRSQRSIVCILFGFGAFACVASMLRLSQLHQLHTIDITYNSINSINWSVAEIGTAILCASMPSLRPLLSVVLRVTEGSTRRGNSVTAERCNNGSSIPFSHRPSRANSDASAEEGKSEWQELPSSVPVAPSLSQKTAKPLEFP